MSRFRLDPRDARVHEPAAPPPPPVAAMPPPPAPRPAPAKAPPVSMGRRRALVGVLALAAVLVVAALAFSLSTALAYPEKYLLDEDEYPAGMRTAPLSAADREELGISDNPGELDRARLEDDFQRRDGTTPEEGWALLLTSAQGSGRIAILALQYANEDDARGASQDLRAICSFAGGAVLRDGDVVVVIAPEGMRSGVAPVVEALRDKTSDLAPVCGASSA